jgi:hypothetical protein
MQIVREGAAGDREDDAVAVAERRDEKEHGEDGVADWE